jgi:hypothetical protein
MLANVPFISAQDVRGSCGVGLRVLIEGDATTVAEVSSLADAQYDTLHEAVKAPEQVRRRNVREIPRADCVLDWLQDGVLPNALSTPQHECVVDLFARTLHAMR